MCQCESELRGRGLQFVIHAAPALAYVMAVFYLGSIPMPRLPEATVVGTDKLVHLLAFFGMVVVFIRAGRYGWPSLSDRRLRFAAALASSTVGGLLEVFQLAVPGRSAEALDWAADCAGAALSALMIRSRWVSPLAIEEPSP